MRRGEASQRALVMTASKVRFGHIVTILWPFSPFFAGVSGGEVPILSCAGANCPAPTSKLDVGELYGCADCPTLLYHATCFPAECPGCRTERRILVHGRPVLSWIMDPEAKRDGVAKYNAIVLLGDNFLGESQKYVFLPFF